MSLKPPKHSEMKWPDKRESRKRKISLDYNLIVTEGTKTTQTSLTCQFADAEGLARVLHDDILRNVEGAALRTIAGIEREASIISNRGMWYNGALETRKVQTEVGACGHPTAALFSCTVDVKRTFSCDLIGVTGTIGGVPCTFLILGYIKVVTGTHFIDERSTLELHHLCGR